VDATFAIVRFGEAVRAWPSGLSESHMLHSLDCQTSSAEVSGAHLACAFDKEHSTMSFPRTRSLGRWCGLAAIASVACLAGCSSTVQTWPVVHTSSIKMARTQESTRVAEGQILTVQLPTEGGTPYIWRLSPDSFSNGFVQLESRREQQTPNGTFASIGEPAMDVFTFHAVNAGQTTLKFMLDQRMNADHSRIAQMTLHIDVFNARVEARAAAEAREAAQEAAEAQAIAAAESSSQ
jgi:predicted secreted protein